MPGLLNRLLPRETSFFDRFTELATQVDAGARAMVELLDNYTNAAVQAALVRRPRLVAATGRLLTAPVVGRAIAGGWAVYWNELLDGALPGGARNTAAVAAAVARAATSRSGVRRSIENALGPER